MKKTINDIEVFSKVVLLRVDFNVPLKNDCPTDCNRIIEALPTIKFLQEKGAKIILLSHLGKVNHKEPEKTEQDKAKNDMGFVAPKVKEYVGEGFSYCASTNREVIKETVSKLKNGEVILLQNTRYEKGEEKNDPELSAFWASLADVYVMDAFGSAHRKHASTYGVPSIMNDQGKPTAIGFLVEKEVQALSKCVAAKEHPYIAILGGVKVSDKIKVIEGLLEKADKILIGGAMAHTFLKAKGSPVGDSKVEEDQLDFARKCLDIGKNKIVLPIDQVVINNFDNPTDIKYTEDVKIPDGYLGVDIGIKTVELFKKELEGAKIIFWNGPMGVFENEKFAHGTIGICKAITSQKNAFSVIGGGDSAAAAIQFGFKKKFSHLSTGGGASLEMIENDGHLPGIDIIQDEEKSESNA